MVCVFLWFGLVFEPLPQVMYLYYIYALLLDKLCTVVFIFILLVAYVLHRNTIENLHYCSAGGMCCRPCEKDKHAEDGEMDRFDQLSEKEQQKEKLLSKLIT